MYECIDNIPTRPICTIKLNIQINVGKTKNSFINE